MWAAVRGSPCLLVFMSHSKPCSPSLPPSVPLPSLPSFLFPSLPPPYPPLSLLLLPIHLPLCLSLYPTHLTSFSPPNLISNFPPSYLSALLRLSHSYSSSLSLSYSLTLLTPLLDGFFTKELEIFSFPSISQTDDYNRLSLLPLHSDM